MEEAKWEAIGGDQRGGRRGWSKEDAKGEAIGDDQRGGQWRRP